MQFWRDCWSSIHPFHLFISIYKHINTFEHTISLNQCMVWLSCRSVSQGDNWYRHAIMLQCLSNTNLLSVLNYHLTQFVEMSYDKHILQMFLTFSPTSLTDNTWFFLCISLHPAHKYLYHMHYFHRLWHLCNVQPKTKLPSVQRICPFTFFHFQFHTYSSIYNLCWWGHAMHVCLDDISFI